MFLEYMYMPFIRLVKIEVPRPHTSFSRLVPAYEVPLWRRQWEGFIDTNAEITVSEAPACMTTLSVRDIPDVGYERQRLSEEFRRHHVTGDPIFNSVYPGDTFEDAYTKYVEANTVDVAIDEQGTIVDIQVPVPVETEDLIKISGVGKKLSLQLVDAGYFTYEQIADAELDELIKTVESIGISNAESIQESARELAAAPAT